MAWNCDETRFILYVPGSTAQAGGQQGWAMYDGTTYARIKFLDINPGDVEQFYWDHADPATLRYIDNHSSGSTNLADLTAINVETGAKTIIHSFLPNGLPPGCPSGTQGVRCGYPFALGVNAQGQRIWGLGAFGTHVPNVSGELGMWVFGFNEATGAFTLYDTSVVPQPQARGSTPFPSVSGQFFHLERRQGFEFAAHHAVSRDRCRYRQAGALGEFRHQRALRYRDGCQRQRSAGRFAVLTQRPGQR
jgi:hypothetical protein